MAALTADRDTHERVGLQIVYDVAAATEIFKGSLVQLDAAGDAEPCDGTASHVIVGRAAEYVNNTGAAGASTVQIEQGVFKWENDGSNTVVAADLGQLAYGEDDQTVGNTAGTLSIVGRIVTLDSDGVWVKTELSNPQS